MRQIAGPDPSPATTKPKVNRDLDIRALEVLFDIGLDKALDPFSSPGNHYAADRHAQ